MSNLPRERERRNFSPGLGCTDRDPHVDVRRRRRRRLFFLVFGLPMRKGETDNETWCLRRSHPSDCDQPTMDGYDDTEWQTPCRMETSENCRHDRELGLCPGL